MAGLFLAGVTLIVCGAVQPLAATEKVVLQLRWDHQFQFAGFYAAVWQGYYDEAGLAVDIRPAVMPDGRTVSPISEVIAGRANFAVAGPDILTRRQEGTGGGLVVVSPIFQQSATAVIARHDSGLRTLADMSRLRLWRVPGDIIEAEVRAALKAEGVAPEILHFIAPANAPPRSIELLRQGQIDAYIGHTLPLLAWSRAYDLDFTVLRPSTYGIDFYGDTLFTSAALATTNPDLVRRFRDASLKGWRYALEHSDVMAERIARDLPRTLPTSDLIQANRLMVPEVRRLTLYPTVELGHTNPRRWQRMFDMLRSVGVVDGTLDLDRLLFNPEREAEKQAQLWARITVAIVVSLLLLGAFLVLRDRWLREQALRRSRAHLANAQRIAQLGSWEWREGSEYCEASEEVFRIFGLEPSHLSPRYALFRDMIAPEDRSLVKAKVREALNAHSSYRIEYRILPPDGRPRVVLEQGAVLPAGRGHLPHILGTVFDITERRQTEDRIRTLAAAVDNSRDCVGIVSLDLRGIYLNQAGRDLVGLPSTLTDISNLSLPDLLVPESLTPTVPESTAVLSDLLPAVLAHGHWTGEAALQHHSTGAAIPVELDLFVVEHGENRNPACYALLARDIRPRQQAEAELRLAASVYHSTIEGILITDARGVIVSVNPAFTDITGYSAEEAIGQTPRLLKSDHHDTAFYQNMWEELQAKGTWQGEVWNRRKTGEVYLEWLSISQVPGAGGLPTRYVAVFADVTEQRRKDEHIRHQAYHDILTGLPNRLLLMDRLQHALDVARQDNGLVAVVFLDIDRFKTINDSLGHECGDHLLQAVARRLSGCVRRSDTVARLGGDEFVIVLAGIGQAAEVPHIIEKLHDALKPPVMLGERELHIGASLGIGIYPQDGDDANTLLKNADTAMYQAKGAGRNTFRFFDASMNSRAIERLDLEANLRRALENEEFVLFYQPKIDLETGLPCGLEALIRWNSPTSGMIPPGVFIPVAEETGLIHAIGDWALRRAGLQIKEWLAADVPFTSIAVNLSARQFHDEALTDRIEAIFHDYGIDPNRLEIELTESTVMTNAEQAIAVLQRLRDMGVTIAVDDFGTGYSSLSYLKKLPIDTLKIDRSFMIDAASGPEGAAIARTIIALAHALRLGIVAEGVETAEQVAFLRNEGCPIAQGFYYAKPMPATATAAWLQQQTQQHANQTLHI